jgi:hypothetical protein
MHCRREDWLRKGTTAAKEGQAMDGQRFDSIAKGLRTRRAALGLAASLGALLEFGPHDDGEARNRCKRIKECGPCKRC